MRGVDKHMQRLAAEGALRNWCPSCERKNGLGRDGSCRYCAVRAASWDIRRARLVQWIQESPEYRDPFGCYVSQGPTL